MRSASCVEGIHPHHLISRREKAFKADPRVGIGLCPVHHRFAHDKPSEFKAWLKANHPVLLGLITFKARMRPEIPDFKVRGEVLNEITKSVNEFNREEIRSALWNGTLAEIVVLVEDGNEEGEKGAGKG